MNQSHNSFINFISAKSLVEANPVDKRGVENWEARDQPLWWLMGLMTTHQHTIKCHTMKNPHCLAINPFPSWAVSLSSALLKATELFSRGPWTMQISGRELRSRVLASWRGRADVWLHDTTVRRRKARSVLTAPVMFITISRLPWQSGVAASSATGSSWCWIICYHIVGALRVDKQTHVIAGKGHRYHLLTSCRRCRRHQPIAVGKKVPLPCSSCGVCKACFGRWNPMLKQAKICLFWEFHWAVRSGWCLGLGQLWTCLGADI